jgi:hypothetical protein
MQKTLYREVEELLIDYEIKSQGCSLSSEDKQVDLILSVAIKIKSQGCSLSSENKPVDLTLSVPIKTIQIL